MFQKCWMRLEAQRSSRLTGVQGGPPGPEGQLPVLYLVIAALVVVAACVAFPLVRRNHRLDEVDRFHVARSMTTTWASQPQGPVHIPAQGDDAGD